jgi:hypothetical protein
VFGLPSDVVLRVSELIGERGTVVVPDAPKLADKLRGRGHVIGSPGEQGVDVVVTVSSESEALARAAEQLRPGGMLITVGRGNPAAASGRLLCAGMTGILQVRCGRRIITAGCALPFSDRLAD